MSQDNVSRIAREEMLSPRESAKLRKFAEAVEANNVADGRRAVRRVKNGSVKTAYGRVILAVVRNRMHKVMTA